MKASIRQRLQKLTDRFEEVGRVLATDEVPGGSPQYRDLTVEYARLQPLAERFGQYHHLERDLAAARELQADPDAGLRSLGEEESAGPQRAPPAPQSQVRPLPLPQGSLHPQNNFL